MKQESTGWKFQNGITFDWMNIFWNPFKHSLCASSRATFVTMACLESEEKFSWKIYGTSFQRIKENKKTVITIEWLNIY